MLNAIVDGKPYLYKFSPLTWSYIGCIDVGGRTQCPTITYVLFSYIIICSFLYTLLHLFFTIIFNIRYMQWGITWGDVLGSAGTSGIMTSLNIRYNTVGISGSVIRYFTPMQAMFFSFILMWLSLVFVGMLIYVINIED